MNVNLEPIIRGLKSDFFLVYNPFHICRIQLQKKKSGVKKCLEILPLRGEGVGVGRGEKGMVKNCPCIPCKGRVPIIKMEI